ncbi:MAG: GGDEF domain-containing protein [Actinomycetota bacterium]
MSPDELDQLLRRPGTVIIAIEATGGRAVPLPAGLSANADRVLDVDSPLDALTPASQGQAVVAFEEARRTGRGTAVVRRVGEPDDRRLDIVDVEQEHDCFLAVLGPAADDGNGEVERAALPPLRAVYRLNVTGVIESVSPEFTAMLGWPPDEVVGRSSLDVIHPDDHETGIMAWVELLERPNTSTRLRQRFATADGGWRWCEVTDANHLDDDPPCVEGELVDISREMAAQVALEQRERLLDRLSRALPTGVCHLGAGRGVDFSNERWHELTGLGQGDGLDALLELVAEPEAVRAAVDRAVDGGVDADLDVTLDGDGACAFGTLHLRPLREDDEHIGLLLTLDDLTSLRRSQLQLADQARRDPLTGVLNRAGVEEMLVDRLRATGPSGAGPAVLFLDLDRFKRINDTHGHAAGDEVLRLVATHLLASAREVDGVGRLGGDEFLVVLDGGTTAEPSIERLASRVAERIRAGLPSLADALAETVTGGHPVEVGASIGIAVARPDDDFDALLGRADQAMYSAKRADRSTADEAAQPSS